MKKILAVVLVVGLMIMAVPPIGAEAGGGWGGGGWHGGGGHGYWGPGPWLFGIAALGAASNILAPRPYVYPAYRPVVYAPAPMVVAEYPSGAAMPQAQMSMERTSCNVSGCYYLEGDGVQAPYRWVPMPSPQMTPPPPGAYGR